MKTRTLLIVLALTAGIACALYVMQSANGTQKVAPALQDVPRIDSEIRVMYGLDVSKSGPGNGIDLIHSSEFALYFNEIHRDIDLYFGVISSRSTRQPLHVFLPACRLARPTQPDLKDLSIIEYRNLKASYATSLRWYRIDSQAYFSNRATLISRFRKSVDSLVGIYNHHLTDTTDLTTVVSIAEKAFSLSAIDHAINYLILNTDGKDSYHKKAKKMNVPATVIVIGSNAIALSDLKEIVDKSMLNTEQAIQYTLRK